MSNERQRRTRTRRTRRGRFLRLLVLLTLLSVVALISSGAGLYVALAGNLPSLEAQEEFVAPQTTKVYSGGEEPELLAELHGVENREIVPGDRIAPVMRDAVVAVEDERFYEHQGVDLLGIVRALVTDLQEGEIVQGGSTITQQFVKNAYISDEKTLDRKIKEAALAYQLEKRWTKDKILNEYLNTIYFGEGAYGVEAAAKEYFGVHAADLVPAQAALLAAIPKSPGRLSPRVNPDDVLLRRNAILNKMFRQGFLTAAELETALTTPIELAPSRRGGEHRLPYWVELVREQLVARYGSNTVLNGGLRVYTSVDTKRQAAAEEAVKTLLDREGDPEAALVSLDLRTGEVVAMVGGENFAEQKFNLATQAKRQPGSSFKPFVLATALEQGMGPGTVYESGPATLAIEGADDWRVKSSNLGSIPLSEATARSSNGAFARLIMDVSPSEVVRTAAKLGIESELQAVPAIALGGLREGVSPMEMAVAYGSFATGGYRLAGSIAFEDEHPLYPITITRVEDAEGRILDTNRLVKNRVMDSRHAFALTEMLKGVIDHGTGRAADIGRPAAGKTGTTQEYRDAWFVGYTPELVTAVWVGHMDAQEEMTDVHGEKVTGGSFPARIWAAYMKAALEGVEPTDFPKPEGVVWQSVEICLDTGLLATQWCPEVRQAELLEGMLPDRRCDVHGPEQLEVPDVVGLDVTAAKEKLKDLRYAVAVVERDGKATAGEVLEQAPAGGTQLMQGETVTLTVASGSRAKVKVPDLSGLSYEDSLAKLEKAGLLGARSERPSEADAGVVIGQEPEAGVEAAGGATVTVIVSSGPAGQSTSTTGAGTPVPDVVGMQAQQATAKLKQAGFEAVVTPIAASDGQEVGRVAEQDPGPGNRAPAGSAVRLTVYAQP